LFVASRDELRRMPEELHFNLEVPGSRPGRALAGAIAQLVEHQTPLAGVVSPTLVAARILPLVPSLIYDLEKVVYYF
jgi:hypothetical protein